MSEEKSIIRLFKPKLMNTIMDPCTQLRLYETGTAIDDLLRVGNVYPGSYEAEYLGIPQQDFIDFKDYVYSKN